MTTVFDVADAFIVRFTENEIGLFPIQGTLAMQRPDMPTEKRVPTAWIDRNLLLDMASWA